MSVPIDGLAAVLAKDVWPFICPDWKGKEIIFEAIGAGAVNYTAVFHTADDIDNNNAVVARIFRTARDLSQEKYDEFVYMQVAHIAGCFSKVRAVFLNGVIYDYMPGENLKAKDMQDPTVVQKVARALAKFHLVDTQSAALVDRLGRPYTLPVKDNFVNRLTETLKTFPLKLNHKDDAKRLRQEVDFTELYEEIQFAKQYLDGLDLPVVNTHDDFHIFNVLYDKKSGQVNIVDYEFSGFHCFPTLDLSMLLNFWIYNKDVLRACLRADNHLLDAPSKPETDETKLMWLQAYLEQKHELEGGSKDDVTEAELDLWFTMLQITDVLHLLNRLLLFLVAMERTPRATFWFILYKIAREEYFRRKPTLAALRTQYLSQRSTFKMQKSKRIFSSANPNDHVEV